MDVMSDVLQQVRLQSTVYFQANFSAPWGMEMEVGPVAQFHLVVRGNCWLHTPDRRTPLPLSGGDIVMLPHGMAHWLTGQPEKVGVSGQAVLTAVQKKAPLFQGKEVNATLVCGHFSYDHQLHHPLLQNLPTLIYIRGAEQLERDWLDTAVSLIIHETARHRPGSRVIIDRLADVLFIQIVRSYLRQQSQQNNFLYALSDPEIGSALQLIHDAPEASWTLAGIALQVGLSRTAFANRFRDLVGLTPMRYITGWRMQLARRLLQESDMPLAAIAHRVGYASEAAFSRAFRREFAQNPGAARQARL